MEYLIIYMLGSVISTIGLYYFAKLNYNDFGYSDYIGAVSAIERECNYEPELIESRKILLFKKANRKKLFRCILVSLIPFLNIIFSAVFVVGCILIGIASLLDFD